MAVEAERATTHSSRIARQKSPKRVATFVRALIFSSFSFYSSLLVSASHFNRLRQRRRLWPRLSLLRRLCDYTTALPVYRRLIPARPDAAKRATTTTKKKTEAGILGSRLFLFSLFLIIIFCVQRYWCFGSLISSAIPL